MDFTFSEYDQMVKDTAIYYKAIKGMALDYVGLGLQGETGEFCDKIKKVIRDHQGLIDDQMHQDLVLELGDCLWYLSSAVREACSSLTALTGFKTFTEFQKRCWQPGVNGSFGQLVEDALLQNRVAGALALDVRTGRDIRHNGLCMLNQLSICAKCLGVNLEYVARKNIKKLEDRKARGTLSGSGDHR